MSDYCNYDYAVRASVNLFEDSVEMITKYATDMANERLGEEISEAYKTYYLDAARKDDLAAIAGEEATKKSNETLLASAEKTQKDLRERYEEIKEKLETLEEEHKRYPDRKAVSDEIDSYREEMHRIVLDGKKTASQITDLTTKITDSTTKISNIAANMTARESGKEMRLAFDSVSDVHKFCTEMKSNTGIMPAIMGMKFDGQYIAVLSDTYRKEAEACAKANSIEVRDYDGYAALNTRLRDMNEEMYRDYKTPYMQNLYTTEAGQSIRKINHAKQFMATVINLKTTKTTSQVRHEAWDDVENAVVSIRSGATPLTDNKYKDEWTRRDKNGQILRDASGKAVGMSTADMFKFLDEKYAHTGTSLLRGTDARSDALKMRTEILKEYKDVIFLDKNGNIDTRKLKDMRDGKGVKLGDKVPTAEEVDFLLMTNQSSQHSNIIKGFASSVAMRAVMSNDMTRAAATLVRRTGQLVKAGRSVKKLVDEGGGRLVTSFRLDRMKKNPQKLIEEQKKIAKKAAKAKVKKPSKLKKYTEKKRIKRNEKRIKKAAKKDKRREWWEGTALGRFDLWKKNLNEKLYTAVNVKDRLTKKLLGSNNKLLKRFGGLLQKGIKKRIFTAIIAVVAGLSLVYMISSGFASLMSTISSFFEGLIPTETIAGRTITELQDLERMWVAGLRNPANYYDDFKDGTNAVKYGEDGLELNEYLATFTDIGEGGRIAVNDENEMYIYPFGFTPAKSETFLAKEITAYDENVQFSVTGIGDSHVSNIKDIICMTDVMFDMDIDSNNDEELNILTMTRWECSWETIKRNAKNAWRFVTQIFGKEYDDEPAAPIPNYRRVYDYARAVFFASHREVIDLIPVVYPLRVREGDEGTTIDEDTYKLGGDTYCSGCTTAMFDCGARTDDAGTAIAYYVLDTDGIRHWVGPSGSDFAVRINDEENEKCLIAGATAVEKWEFIKQRAKKEAVLGISEVAKASIDISDNGGDVSELTEVYEDGDVFPLCWKLTATTASSGEKYWHSKALLPSTENEIKASYSPSFTLTGGNSMRTEDKLTISSEDVTWKQVYNPQNRFTYVETDTDDPESNLYATFQYTWEECYVLNVSGTITWRELVLESSTVLVAKTDDDGNVVMDEDGNPVYEEETVEEWVWENMSRPFTDSVERTFPCSISVNLTYTHECDGHVGWFCGGHVKAKAHGLVYTMPTQLIRPVEGAEEPVWNKVGTAKVDTLLDAVNANHINLMLDSSGNWAQGVMAGIEIGDDADDPQDIFDVDLANKYAKGIFPAQSWPEYEGWTDDNITLAGMKFDQDWKETYNLPSDIPTGFGTFMLLNSDIERIDTAMKDVYGTALTESRLNAINLALKAVGNGSYDMEHHTHGYLGACGKDHVEHCTITDCSGFVSYVFLEGGSSTIGAVESTVGLASHARRSYGAGDAIDWSSAGVILPGDAVVATAGVAASDGGRSHTLLYIGYTDKDIELSTGTIPAGSHITVDCLKIESADGYDSILGDFGLGNIYLRWGADEYSPGLYGLQSTYMYNLADLDDRRLYVVPFE